MAVAVPDCAVGEGDFYAGGFVGAGVEEVGLGVVGGGCWECGGGGVSEGEGEEEEGGECEFHVVVEVGGMDCCLEIAWFSLIVTLLEAENEWIVDGMDVFSAI